MGWARVCRLLGFVGVAFFFISAFTPVPNLLSRWFRAPSDLGPAEAIVVLGGGVRRDGTLSNSSLRRTLHGIVLHRAGLAPLLVFLGPARDEGQAEAEIRAELARKLGIAPGVILTESSVRTTREEAARTRALLQGRGVRTILLVADAHHMARARSVFERAGFEVRAAPTDELSSRASTPEGRFRLMRGVLEECLAWLYYRIAGYL
ncbi:MAG: YdcF family protein [Candidatus Methylomirabilales bacterium]